MCGLHFKLLCAQTAPVSHSVLRPVSSFHSFNTSRRLAALKSKLAKNITLLISPDEHTSVLRAQAVLVARSVTVLQDTLLMTHPVRVRDCCVQLLRANPVDLSRASPVDQEHEEQHTQSDTA